MVRNQNNRKMYVPSPLLLLLSLPLEDPPWQTPIRKPTAQEVRAMEFQQLIQPPRGQGEPGPGCRQEKRTQNHTSFLQ